MIRHPDLVTNLDVLCACDPQGRGNPWPNFHFVIKLSYFFSILILLFQMGVSIEVWRQRIGRFKMPGSKASRPGARVEVVFP